MDSEKASLILDVILQFTLASAGRVEDVDVQCAGLR
jgi:hypothetical protein